MSRVLLTSIQWLPATLKPTEAFQLLGIGRTLGYEKIRDGSITSIRVGQRLLIPTAPLLATLGVEPTDLTAPPTPTSYRHENTPASDTESDGWGNA